MIGRVEDHHIRYRSSAGEKVNWRREGERRSKRKCWGKGDDGVITGAEIESGVMQMM